MTSRCFLTFLTILKLQEKENVPCEIYILIVHKFCYDRRIMFDSSLFSIQDIPLRLFCLSRSGSSVTSSPQISVHHNYKCTKYENTSCHAIFCVIICTTVIGSSSSRRIKTGTFESWSAFWFFFSSDKFDFHLVEIEFFFFFFLLGEFEREVDTFIRLNAYIRAISVHFYYYPYWNKNSALSTVYVELI